MGGGDDGHVDADGNCSDDMGGASTGYVRRISSKNRRYVRDPVHPKPCVIDRSLTRKERKKEWKDWAVSLARFDCIGSCDCGCSLHLEGCYRYIMNNVGLHNLREIVVARFARPAESYESVRNMLTQAAELKSGTDNWYNLHYKIYGSYPVCRVAYRYLLAIKDSTLRDAERDFMTGKVKWGNSCRRSRRTTLHDTRREDAASWIQERVLLFAEEQPNAHELIHVDEDTDSDVEGLQWQRNSDNDLVVVRLPDCEQPQRRSKSMLTKWKCQRHMDPVIVKVHLCLSGNRTLYSDAHNILCTCRIGGKCIVPSYCACRRPSSTRSSAGFSPSVYKRIKFT